jgi:hypothetical protein
MNIDITKQRQPQTALEGREHELSLIIEKVPAFVWSASMLADLLLASPCFAQSVPSFLPGAFCLLPSPGVSRRSVVQSASRRRQHKKTPQGVY